MKWKKTDRERIKEMIYDWMDVLLLAGWEFTISFMEDDHDGVTADCSPNYRYRTAYIRIYPQFITDDRGDQKKVILHELLHIIVHPYTELVEGAMNGKLVTNDEEKRVNEYMVSWLTDIIYSK